MIKPKSLKPARRSESGRVKSSNHTTSVSITSYFEIDDIVLTGKFKNSRGRIVAFGEDKWGNPTVEIEPLPKGRKKNKIIGLFRIWRADIRES